MPGGRRLSRFAFSPSPLGTDQSRRHKVGRNICPKGLRRKEPKTARALWLSPLRGALWLSALWAYIADYAPPPEGANGRFALSLRRLRVPLAGENKVVPLRGRQSETPFVVPEGELLRPRPTTWEAAYIASPKGSLAERGTVMYAI